MSPLVVKVARGGGTMGSGRPPPGGRALIRAFSDKSRRLFRLRFAQIEWPERLRLLFITLTYPGDYPKDPVLWKRHLHAYWKAWRRRWCCSRRPRGQRRKHKCDGPYGAWALEFQKRGAPHFHLCLVAPANVPDELVQAWSAEAWYRIAGAGDERHLRQHRKREHCKRADGPRGLGVYLRKEITKGRQKELPQWLIDASEGAGLWWGIWGFDPAINERAISDDEFQTLRRLTRRLLARRGVRCKMGRFHSAPLYDVAAWSRPQWALSRELLRYLLLLRGADFPIDSFASFDRSAQLRLVDAQRLPLPL